MLPDARCEQQDTFFVDARTSIPYRENGFKFRFKDLVMEIVISLCNHRLGRKGTVVSEPGVVVKAFTELAPRYEATVDRELRAFWGVSYQQFLGRLIGLAGLQAGDYVLDVATGTAYIPSQISERIGDAGRVFGVDITPAMLVRGAARLAAEGIAPRVRLVGGSGLALPLADGALDVALCGLGTHHIGVSPLLSEMRRVLRPGGRLVVADVAATAFWRSLFGKGLLRILMVGYGFALRGARTQAEIEAFGNICTAAEWRVLLAESGFSAIEMEEIPARHRWYPGGVIVRAVSLMGAPDRQAESLHPLLSGELT